MKTREQILANLKEHTIVDGFGEDDNGGSARLKLSNNGGLLLTVVASWGEGWDHVSVSKPKRAPTWDEMCFVKDVFFNPNECVIQYHPANSLYVNIHPNCLHLWRSQHQAVLMPPRYMV